jgi:hypothetical protein
MRNSLSLNKHYRRYLPLIHKEQEDELKLTPEEEEKALYISSTANGDGLEFDKRLPSIFEDIKSIKSNQQAKPNKVTISDEEGLTLDQVPKDTIRPLTILIEAISNLDNLRSDLQAARLREEEFANVLKSIKFSDQILTCSHTL